MCLAQMDVSLKPALSKIEGRILGTACRPLRKAQHLITIAIILLQRHLALEDTVFESKF